MLLLRDFSSSLSSFLPFFFPFLFKFSFFHFFYSFLWVCRCLLHVFVSAWLFVPSFVTECYVSGPSFPGPPLPFFHHLNPQSHSPSRQQLFIVISIVIIISASPCSHYSIHSFLFFVLLFWSPFFLTQIHAIFLH